MPTTVSVRVDAELRAQHVAGAGRIELVEVDAERHDDELLRAADPKRVADLAKLLLAENDDAIGVEPRQRPLDRQKKARLPLPVVAVKNVAVVGVDEAASLRRPADEAIEHPGDAPDRAAFAVCVCTMSGRKRTISRQSLPDRREVARRELAAHRRNHDRRHAVRGGERAHVFFAGRHGSGDEQRFEAVAGQRLAQPDDVPRRSADVEPGDETQDADRPRRISFIVPDRGGHARAKLAVELVEHARIETRGGGEIGDGASAWPRCSRTRPRFT